MAPLDIIIGISGRRSDSGSVEAMIEKIEKAGAKICLFDNHEEHQAKNDLACIHALVIMGSDLDIDPAHYIERYPEGDPRRAVHPKTKSEAHCTEGKARAAYETAVIRTALQMKMPLLGICGGMQRINVLCGGTLIQHVPDLVGHDKLHQKTHGIAPHIPTLPIVIQGGTKMAMIARNVKMAFATSYAPDMPKVVMENSLRHQSIDLLGKGLIASSLSDAIRQPGGSAKYLIEAIEADPAGPYGNQFLIGVQWHPEFGASPLGPSLITHLLDAARDFAVRMKKYAKSSD